ncbi:MAG TPA: hypothetical protein VF041_18720 [Gemmatimonadaceae bacterium]
MPFTLQVTITGLCLYTVEPASGSSPAKVHVLMPGSGGMTDDHSAVLMYDPKYSGETPPPPGPVSVDLRGCAIELPSTSAIAPGQEIPANPFPAELVDIDAYAGSPLARSFVGNDPGTDIQARVSLGAGEMTFWESGGPWIIAAAEHGRPSRESMLAWRLTWTVEGIDEDHLDLTFTGLNGNPAPPPIRLVPVGDMIHVFAFHAPAYDLPPNGPLPTPPEPGQAAHHFMHIYAPWPNPKSMMVPVAKPFAHPHAPPESGGVVPFLATTATCVGGRASLG